EACDLLAGWDGLLNLGSVGAIIWREWLGDYDAKLFKEQGALFEIPFDAASPIETPAGLAPGDLDSDRSLDALARAVLRLDSAGLALDTPFGEAQFARKGDAIIPIHGGISTAGVTNWMLYDHLRSDLAPPVPRAEVLWDRTGLTADGYQVNYGTSFIMCMQFTDEGPEAQALLSYSQSAEPDSPWFADQTERFSEKQWRPILWHEQDIAADPNLIEYQVSGVYVSGYVGDLIAPCVAEGELDGTGNFTLDPAAALAKLREHQLADPTRFVLSWVRAAVLLGASAIDIGCDADDVHVGLEIEPLAEAEFDQLWAAAVGSSSSARVRGCRELALGINGALCWGAKSVTIVTGQLCVQFDRNFEMRRSSLKDSHPRTVLMATRPLGWELVRRYLLDVRNELPEELLLARACAHASIPIRLEGRRLDRDWTASMDPWVRVEIDEDGRRGALVLRAGTPSQLRVLVAGVEVALIELPRSHGYVESVVDDPLL